MAPPKGWHNPNKGKPGRVWTEEQRNKASRSHMGNPSRIGQKRSPEECAKQSATMTGKKLPPFTEEHKRRLSERVVTDEWRLKNSLSKKGKPNLNRRGIPLSEEHKRKISERVVTPETRERMSVAKKGKPNLKLKGIKRSEETCRRISASHIGLNSGANCHLWRNGASFEPYCPKFSRLKREQVRWFYNKTCPVCGFVQQKRKLNVHHVSYDKQVGCNGAPQLYVPLCDSCHAKTNFDRDYWEQHFMELIYLQFGGKCYLTREELKQRMVEGC